MSKSQYGAYRLGKQMSKAFAQLKAGKSQVKIELEDGYIIMEKTKIGERELIKSSRYYKPYHAHGSFQNGGFSHTPRWYSLAGKRKRLCGGCFSPIEYGVCSNPECNWDTTLEGV